MALLRSLVVHPDYRAHGLGRRLVRQLLRGIKPCDRDEVHPQVLGSTEFSNASDAAIVMRIQMLTCGCTRQRAELVVELDDVRSKEPKGGALFHRDLLRECGAERVALGVRHHRQLQPGVA